MFSDLGGLADEHGSNAKAHDEKPAEAVQQVNATFELCAVRIDNRNCDDGYETVERVKRWEHCFVAVHHDDAQDDLNKHGGFGNAGVPPQCACAQGDKFVGGERPDSGKAVGNNDDPRPVGMEIIQSLCVHRNHNLPHSING